MNNKRVAIALTAGLAAGLFCAYGTVLMVKKGQANFPVTAGILASIVYNRLLLGFIVGIADRIKLNCVLRGAIIGAIVSLALSIMPLVDGQSMGSLMLVAFGVVYGIIADVLATVFTKPKVDVNQA